MEEFLKELSINPTGQYVDENYVIKLTSYDDFSSIYNKLEQTEKITKDSDESSFNIDNAHVVYFSDEYEVILNGDLNDEVYQLMIKRSE